jgi:hypothetical protein
VSPTSEFIACDFVKQLTAVDDGVQNGSIRSALGLEVPE